MRLATAPDPFSTGSTAAGVPADKVPGARDHEGLTTVYNLQVGVTTPTALVRSPRLAPHEIRPVYILAMCEDFNRRNWIACCPYETYRSIKKRTIEPRATFDRNHEVVSRPGKVVFIELKDVVGPCFVMNCGQNTWIKMSTGRTLPGQGLYPAFFCRDTWTSYTKPGGTNYNLLNRGL